MLVAKTEYSTISTADGAVKTIVKRSHRGQMTQGLSRALLHVHNVGLAHDDAKPDNTMLALAPASERGMESTCIIVVTVTVIDFGACIHSGIFTSSGTSWYMATEYMQRLPDGPHMDV